MSDSEDVRLAVFDFGGTLIHDTADVAAIFKAALAQHGLEVDDGRLVALRGAAKREAIARLAAGSEADPERIYATFRELLVAAFAGQGVRTIDGVEQALDRLRKRGLRLALTTGFDRVVTEWLLARLPWATSIDAVVCADEVAVGRPAPYMVFRAMEKTRIEDVRQVATVGDTDNDLMAGQRAGVGTHVGVLSGAHDRARLEKVPHTVLLGSAAELPDWLERNAGAEKKKARR